MSLKSLCLQVLFFASVATFISGFNQYGSTEARTYDSKLTDQVSILDFIPTTEHDAIRNGVSAFDCWAALNAALTSRNFPYSRSPSVYFPSGKYLFNQTIELKEAVRLYGDGSGQAGAGSALIQFPAGVMGIVVNHAKVGATGAESSIIEGLTLIGTLGPTNSSHGIWLRARAVLRDLNINYFSGDGIHIVATALATDPNLTGNANNFRIESCVVTFNGQNGIFAAGGDVNAGLVTGVSATNNGGWGIYDGSFLGNTYVGCHTESNKLGAYKSDSPDARNMFLGCYSEADQSHSNLTFPAMMVGGLHGAPLTGNFVDLQANPKIVIAETTLATGETISLGIGNHGSGSDAASLLALASSDDNVFRLEYTKGRWHMKYGNPQNPDILHIYNAQATPTNGYLRSVSPPQFTGMIGFPAGYFGGSMRLRAEAAELPTSGTYHQGDILYDINPVRGGYIGWVCIVGGTPGLWRRFGAIEN